MKRLFFFLILLIPACGLMAQLQAVQETNAQALAQKLVGGGITISNVTLTGASTSSGFFYNRGGTQLGLDSGIVLTTGRVQTQFNGNGWGIGGAQTNLASFGTDMPGDADLSALVNPRPTNDAVVLEFDFVPLGDSVKFRYVFSSEEYPVFTCTNFNDVFAFFISGPGINGKKNIALVPGTNVPVAINSINSGRPGGSGNIVTCNAMGPGSPFPQYYVDNIDNLQFTHNGHTTILTAATAVQPCQVYHLKIAIADVNDNSYDSGVFIEASSLRSDPVKIVNQNPTSNGLPYLAEGCHTGGIRIQRSQRSSIPQTVNVVMAGSAINGADYQLIPSAVTIPAGDLDVFVPIIPIVDNLPEGTEILKIYIANGCANSNLYSDSIQIQLRDYEVLGITPAGPLAICGESPQQLSATAGYDTYQWSPAAGLSSDHIANPVALPQSSTVYVCSADLGNCHAKDSVRLIKKTLQLISKKDVNCTGVASGEIRVKGGSSWAAPVSFSINNGNYGSDSVFSGLAAGDYIVRIKDATGCVDSLKISLVQAYPNLDLSTNVISASCSGSNGQLALSANGGRSPYTYSLDGSNFVSSASFSVLPGNYTARVKDDNGCISSASITVTRDAAIVLAVSPGPNACKGASSGAVYLHASGGSGNYSYSIDGVNFQTIDSFIVSIENFTAIVKDDKGCSGTQAVLLPLNGAVYIDAGRDTSICQGTGLHFPAATNANEFLWAANPSLSALNLPDPVASPNTSNTYYVKATKGLCSAYDTIQVNVWPAPQANAGIDSLICVGASIRLQGSGGVAYSWSPAGEFTDAFLPDPVVKPRQSAEYFLKVFSAEGCASLKPDTVRISLVPAVQAFAGKDTVAVAGQPFQLRATELSNSGATIFQWSPSSGLNDATIKNPVAILDKDMIYQLKMITPQGCEGSDEVLIRVFRDADIYVPSGFSPNGDGRNDLLKAIPVGIREFHYFRVFNRWGQLVFDVKDASRGWDGRIGGRMQDGGTFIWMAAGTDIHGNRIERKGTVTIVR